MVTRNPEFPPLFTGHMVLSDDGVATAALDAIARGEAGAGDVFWLQSDDVAEAAFVLEPECVLDEAMQMVPLLMVATGDALGAIGPPKMPFHYRWPDVFVANGGEVGHVFAHMPDGAAADGEPAFLMVGFHLRMTMPENLAAAPGETPDLTALHQEGAGDLTSIDVIDSVSRHFLTWIDSWMDEGFSKAHTVWTGRLDEERALARRDETDGSLFVGLDEHGGALLRDSTDTPQLMTMFDVLGPRKVVLQ